MNCALLLSELFNSKERVTMYFRHHSSELGSNTFLRASHVGRYCPSIPQNDDSIDRYILPRTTAFPQYVINILLFCYFPGKPIFSIRYHPQFSWKNSKNIMSIFYSKYPKRNGQNRCKRQSKPDASILPYH